MTTNIPFELDREEELRLQEANLQYLQSIENVDTSRTIAYGTLAEVDEYVHNIIR